MSSVSLLGIYRPGTTLVHRLPAGVKLSLLSVFSLVVVVIRDASLSVGFLTVTCLLAAYARLDARTTVKALRAVMVVALLLGLYQGWMRGWPAAVEVVCDLFALVVAATVFTATTAIDTMLDAITRWLGPFRRIGVKPERVALAFALMIRAVPQTMEIAQETREAAKARGLERSPRALLIPMALRTVAHAYEMGEALAARGIGDD